MTGPRPSLIRPAPEDFATYAPGKNCWQLVNHYNTSRQTVARWVAETGVKIAFGSMRPVPDQWAELCAAHTIAELVVKLDADRKVIMRWAAETGIEPKPYVRKGRNTRADSRFFHRKTKQAKNLGQMGGGLVVRHDNRARSIFDDAADVLRVERWIVYRCDEKGRANPKGMYWRLGQVILTPDELLMRADKYRRRAA